MKKHLNIPRHGAPRGWLLSFTLLALAVASIAATPLTTASTAPAATPAAGTHELASWTGYWTWDAKNRKWIWTWIWIWDGNPGWVIS